MDRMPIAIQAMVNASVKAGVITDELTKQYGSANGALEKLMQDGKLYAKDILPYFGEEIRKIVESGLDTALKSNVNAMNRLMNVFENAANVIFKSGFAQGLTDFFNTTAELIKQLNPLWTGLSKILGSMFKLLASMINYVKPFLITFGDILKSITDGLGDMSAALAVLSPALWLFMSKLSLLEKGLLATPFGRTVAIFLALSDAIRSAAMQLEEFINIFTHQKSGVYWSPETGTNVNEMVDRLSPFKSFGKFQQQMQMLQNGGLSSLAFPNQQNQPINVNATLNVDGEQLSNSVTKTNNFNNAVDQKMMMTQQ